MAHAADNMGLGRRCGPRRNLGADRVRPYIGRRGGAADGLDGIASAMGALRSSAENLNDLTCLVNDDFVEVAE